MSNAASEPSSRPVPAMRALCPNSRYMASGAPIFKCRRPRISICHLANGTGSRARTYDLRFWRPPLYQLSYARTRALLFHKANENSSALLRRSDQRERPPKREPRCPRANGKFEGASATISRPAACKARPARPSPRPASVLSRDRRSRRDWNSSWPGAIPTRHSP